MPLQHHQPLLLHNLRRCLTTYVQGQYPQANAKIREYFYYVDHQGQLFLDDARMKNFTSCFKEPDFLNFFFRQVRRNNSGGRYDDAFPFVSPCGIERNFIRADDRPYVVTDLFERDGIDYVRYNGAPKLEEEFQPRFLQMLSSGRLYYPAWKRELSPALVKSALAIRLSSHFIYRGGDADCPTHFQWNRVEHLLAPISDATDLK